MEKTLEYANRESVSEDSSRQAEANRWKRRIKTGLAALLLTAGISVLTNENTVKLFGRYDLGPIPIWNIGSFGKGFSADIRNSKTYNRVMVYTSDIDQNYNPANNLNIVRESGKISLITQNLDSREVEKINTTRIPLE